MIKSQNKQQLFMSDFEFKPIHKFFKITISSIKYSKNTNSDIISLHVYNNTPYQVTLPLGLLGYCETNATISPIHEVVYRVNNILQLLDICQSTILDEELSINNIVSNEKRNTDYFTKTPYFKPTFNITNYTKEQQKFLTMFNFDHSQTTQFEFDKLAKQLFKYSTVYATSKFDVGKISSSLHLPLKPDAVFKKQRASKVPIHLHDKVNRLLDILEQYKIISPVNKEEQPKGNTFINPVIVLAKGESLKIVLGARYLNSLIDESKCNWPIEPIQVILTKINGKYFTTPDKNSAYNQMPLDEQSRRLTQFVIGSQQYELNRLFYGISIVPAAFSAFMSKIFRPLILKKNAITYLDDVFMQSQTKEEMLTVSEHYHKILQNENLKAAPDKSHFFLTRVKFLGHNIERNTITPLKSRIDAIQKQLSNFSQMPNAAKSLQMTMNPYLMVGSSVTSNKPLMVFTGTDPEYSVEGYLNAVTANLILNIGPEPINTPLHQNWIHRRTALIQTTLDGAAQQWFSVLPIELKSDWKRFTQEFSKMFDSKRNKQHQRVLCNEIRRLPNEIIKQLAVRIETLVRKAYSLNTHDYKNTKITEILMMTLKHLN